MKNKIKENIKTVSFLDCHNGTIAEIIGDKEKSRSTMFLVYKVLTGEITLEEKIEFNGITYYPPKDDLIYSGTILLPTYAEDYDNVGLLVTQIQDFIHRYLDISSNYEKLATYYILLTWVYDCFETIPYLRAIGDYGTGKSRFQKVIGNLCYKPMFAGGATTPSPIFRIIDLYRGTLLIDEADFRFSDAQSEIVKILNCGYSTGTPVLRTEGEKERMPVAYNVFCPKVLATRERFIDKALESRCLTEIMQGNPRSDIPIHLPKEFYSEAQVLRNVLLMFRFKHYGQIELKPELAIPQVESRINQILLPILSLIEDEDVLEDIIDFAKKYANEIKLGRGEELHSEVLKTMILMVKDNQLLRNKSIAEKMNEGRDLAHGEYKISPAKIGRINSTYFDFKTRQVNGVTEIIWDNQKAQKLCDRFGIDFQPVDHVDDVDLFTEAIKSYKPEDMQTGIDF